MRSAIVAVVILSWGGLAQGGLRRQLEAGAEWEGSGLFEGDIVISEEELASQYGAETARGAREAGVLTPVENGRRNLGLTSTLELWTERDPVDGKVIIPYEISSECLPSSKCTNPGCKYSPEEVREIRRALDIFEQQVGVVKFPNYNPNVASHRLNFIRIHCKPECSSRIGRLGRGNGAQTLQLKPHDGSSSCVSVGIIHHEFEHAMGIWHEQSRPDRDSFVTILEENVISADLHNFYKRSATEIDSLGISYDYASSMHYHANAFSSNGKPTIDARGNAIGQRSELSPKDIEQIRLLYKCPGGGRRATNLCSRDCPCALNEGDCDSDDDCAAGLVCQKGRTGREVCVPQAERCSISKPCPLDWGHCESDAECEGDLVCADCGGIDRCRKQHGRGYFMSKTAPTHPENARLIELLDAKYNMCIDYHMRSRNAYMYKCHGGENQRFYITREGFIKTPFDTSYCLDWDKWSNVRFLGCNGGSNQQFRFSSSRIRLKSNTALCLDYDPRNANLKMSSCHEGYNQRFRWSDYARSIKLLDETRSNLCVDYHLTTGNAYMHPCHGDSNQQFHITREGLIKPAKNRAPCLDWDLRANVYFHPCHGDTNQQFKFWFDGRVRVKANPTLCLAYDPSSTNLLMAKCEDDKNQFFRWSD